MKKKSIASFYWVRWFSNALVGWYANGSTDTKWVNFEHIQLIDQGFLHFIVELLVGNIDS